MTSEPEKQEDEFWKKLLLNFKEPWSILTDAWQQRNSGMVLCSNAHQCIPSRWWAAHSININTTQSIKYD